MLNGKNLAAARNQQKSEMLEAQKKGLRANLIGNGDESRLNERRGGSASALSNTAMVGVEITQQNEIALAGNDLDASQPEVYEESEA